MILFKYITKVADSKESAFSIYGLKRSLCSLLNPLFTKAHTEGVCDDRFLITQNQSLIVNIICCSIVQGGGQPHLTYP